MPLDGHSYLVAQGWSGKGSGLRQGAIARPLAIPQKKTLAGLGKDRDEAFPFWDHLFTVAAKTIQVKIHKDEDEDDSNTGTDSSATPALPTLTRTSTGILSNKRPLMGTPASSSSSGNATPRILEASSKNASQMSKMSIMARAKRDAARRGLYSRFFRGPVLGPDIPEDDAEETTKTVSRSAGEISGSRIDTDGDSMAVGAQYTEGGVPRGGDKPKKERKERKEKQKKGDVSTDDGTSKTIGKKGKKERQTEKKDKRRMDKGKEKETSISDVIDETGTEQKRKGNSAENENVAANVTKTEKWKRKADTFDGPPTDVVIELSRERSRRKKKRSSDKEEQHDETESSLSSKKRWKDEKRISRPEKAEKRRRKEAKAAQTQS